MLITDYYNKKLLIILLYSIDIFLQNFLHILLTKCKYFIMKKSNFEKLLNVINKLRDPEEGCPWDLKQTHHSLLPYLVEECYEYIFATENNDYSQMEEEIGDVLLQVLLHCKIASEKNQFDIESVSKVLTDKLTRRHPHVFSDENQKIEADEVVINWNKIKQNEKKDSQAAHRIDETYLAFPALFSAEKIGKKTFQLGFDWDNAKQVSTKVEEEWQELKEELQKKDNKQRIEEEIGDLLFSVAQLARHLEIDPENSLRNANKKFIGRFNKMELLMKKNHVILEELNQKEMDVYWDQVKSKEKEKNE